MTQKTRILIIEDDQNMLELLSLLLNRDGYEPILAQGGVAGLRLLEEKEVDLILLDLMMDDIDGWSVLKAVKAHDRLRAIPVLIVSARHPLQYPAETMAYAGQFEGYLVKPFIVQDLLAHVAEALD